MASEKRHRIDPVPNLDRRRVLRSIGASTITGASILGSSGSAGASHCPDPDSDDSYVDCDSVSNEFSFYYRPHERRVEGETGLSVGLKGYTSTCNNCVKYRFDLTGIHEAHGESSSRGGQNYVDNFGFRWNVSDNVTPDPQPETSDNVQSGVSDPNESAYPDGSDHEEAFWALADTIVAGGTVLYPYPQFGVPAFLYAVARSSNLGHNNNGSNEVVFNDGWWDPILDSAGFGYYNMRFEVPDDECGWVEFEGFTDIHHSSRVETIGAKRFYLNDHTWC